MLIIITFSTLAVIGIAASLYFWRKAVRFIRETDDVITQDNTTILAIINIVLAGPIAYGAIVLDSPLRHYVPFYMNISWSFWVTQMLVAAVSYELLYLILKQVPKFAPLPLVYRRIMSYSGVYSCLAIWSLLMMFLMSFA